MIEIRHLNKTYRTADKDIVALEDINLTINDGEIFGIIGLSGAGKSTLVRCINLLEQPSAGEVIVDGESITALPRKELLKLRRSIGMIFQGFNLLEQRSVLRNVCFPLEIAGVKKKEAKERAMELLSLVGLADRAEAYPSQLSGGQKQRVAIARALATKPKYLLCDEATSALDPTTTRAILELLEGHRPDLRPRRRHRPQPHRRGGQGQRGVHQSPLTDRARSDHPTRAHRARDRGRQASASDL